MDLEVTTPTDIILARKNAVYIHPTTLTPLKLNEKSLIIIDGHRIFKVIPHPSISPGKIGLSKAQREFLNKSSMNSKCHIAAFEKVAQKISLLKLNVNLLSEQELTINAESFINEFKSEYCGFPFNKTQDFYFFTQETTFKIHVSFVATQGGEDVGIIGEDTKISLVSVNSKLVIESSNSCVILKDVNFENLGIGGLNKEFSTIFRRAFVQRVFKPETIRMLGIMHVKGIMLHGPPGTGKTLIARQIGTLFNARPPKIVNGPEILNKYVGQSEENIRNLFKDAEDEYEKKRQNSLLHIIIFDEIDAICKSRGMSSTGIGDQIVNQLLSKMDGVQSLDNILVIGITNRMDLIDEALLRPGRFEIHLEIGLPDEQGREEILKIHTKKMSRNHFLEKVDLIEVAKYARNYTGAELAALIKSAVSFALERKLKKTDENNNIVSTNEADIRVTMNDFMNALDEIKPAFGVNEEEFCNYNKIFYELSCFTQPIQIGLDYIRKLIRTNLYKCSSILFYGSPGTGKTTISVKIAKRANFPFIKMINPKSLVGMNEYQKISYIKEKFNDAYKSTESIVIIDDIESLIEYVAIGPRFSNAVLQTLRIFIKNEDKNKLFVIGTTSCIDVMRDTGLYDDFYSHCEIPKIDYESYAQLCEENSNFKDVAYDGIVPIKKLLAKLDEPDKFIE